MPVYPFVDWPSLAAVQTQINTALAGTHNNATPVLFAAVYVPQTMTLGPTAEGLIHLPAAGRQGALTLETIPGGVTVATFRTQVSVGDEYLTATLVGGPVTLASGWYNIGLASLAGGSVNAHGLYLTS